MADTGYLYVPPSCAAKGANCKVHVAIHGCKQSAESVGNQFYTGANYAYKSGTQMKAIKAMVNRLTQPQ